MKSVNIKICYTATYTCYVSLQLQNTRGILLHWTRNRSAGVSEIMFNVHAIWGYQRRFCVRVVKIR